MKVRELLKTWQADAGARHPGKTLTLSLSLHDAARLQALAEMYPGRPPTQLLGELVSAALDDLEASFPYVQSNRVAAEDEYGDPIYADSGLTPRFLALTQKHLRALEAAETD